MSSNRKKKSNSTGSTLTQRSNSDSVAPKSGKDRQDIEEIFSALKKRKCEASTLMEISSDPCDGQKNTKIKRRMRSPEKEPGCRSYGIIESNNEHYQIISPEAPLERIDIESGLPVYKAHLLKVGEGGGTSLCPFDCDCCF